MTGLPATQKRTDSFPRYPTKLQPPARHIVGAENVHLQFRRWLVGLGHTAYHELPDDPHRLVAPTKTAPGTVG